MITIKLSFFAILQTELGETQNITVEEPIRLQQVFDLFQSKKGERGSSFFIENDELKKGLTILIDGRNIHALDGLNTILDKNCDVSFFPVLAGG
ncbi:MAG: MoaD/ThiS family protein [Promethearchaeota archaeon]